MTDDERFLGLAHAVLAKEAQPGEQAELQALFEKHPALRQEFDALADEAAIARELLPRLDDLRHRSVRVPPPPMARLTREIRQVFGPRRSPMDELRDLLAQLESWAGRSVRAEGRAVLASVSELREMLSRPEEAVQCAVPRAIDYSPEIRELIRPLSKRPAVPTSREDELAERLSRLEASLIRIEHLAGEWTSEARAVLREFKARARQGSEPEK